jgi:hypothetical protein
MGCALAASEAVADLFSRLTGDMVTLVQAASAPGQEPGKGRVGLVLVASEAVADLCCCLA